jgi:hypothetical protein
MMRARELTLPNEHDALRGFVDFTACLVEAFAERAPAGALRDTVEAAGRAFAGDEAAWTVLVRDVAMLLAFTDQRDGASGELRAFVAQNADLL